MKLTTTSQAYLMGDVIDTTWQKLIALEVSLRTHDFRHQLNQKQLEQYFARINEMRDRLSQIKEVLASESRLNEILSAMGLPPFEPHDPINHRLLHRFIQEKRRIADGMGQFLAGFQTWIEDALKKKHRLRSIFRLSKLKDHFESMEKSLAQLERDQNQLQMVISQLLRSLFPKQRAPQEDLEADLGALYKKLNQMATAISRLEHQVRQDQRQIEAMRHWLQENSQQERRRSWTPSPSIDDLRRLNASWNDYGINQFFDSRHRLTLAKDYLRHFVKTHPPQSSTDTRPWPQPTPPAKPSKESS
jgi:DNA repair exonuclease SbcCD ATPase subunit